MAGWTHEEMCRRAAKELFDGAYVNLGIGIPTLVANYIPEGIHVTFQSENGMLGMGPFPLAGQEDPDLINAGKQTISELPDSSYFDSAYSFGMIRGGHIDLTFLGAWTSNYSWWLFPGVIGAFLTSIYVLRVAKQIFWGRKSDDPHFQHLPDAQGTEWAALGILVFVLVLFGVAPGLALKPVDTATVREVGADVVIAAIGGQWQRPAVDGGGAANVRTVDELAPWLLGERPLDGHRVVVVGGGRAGVGLADLAARQNHHVTVIEGAASNTRPTPRVTAPAPATPNVTGSSDRAAWKGASPAGQSVGSHGAAGSGISASHRWTSHPCTPRSAAVATTPPAARATPATRSARPVAACPARRPAGGVTGVQAPSA